jgi:hypothetical protein
MHQQPAGVTPGVAAAPVALAAAIVPGVDRLIVAPSAQEEEFGVGTIALGSMLVSPPAVVSGEIDPGGGLAGTCGVEREADTDGGVAGPPGMLLQTVVCAAPTGAEETVPVVLPAGVVNDDVDVGDADVDNVNDADPVLVTTGAGTPAISNGDGVLQVTKVPGVAGFDARGTGANVVSEVPDKVVAENGPGLLSGAVTIAPGTVGRLIDVLPMVATCA